jgi:hypothetical protein
MGLGAVIYVPSFIKIGSGSKVNRGDTQSHTQTATWSHKPTLFFQNKECRLKKYNTSSLGKLYHTNTHGSKISCYFRSTITNAYVKNYLMRFYSFCSIGKKAHGTVAFLKRRRLLNRSRNSLRHGTRRFISIFLSVTYVTKWLVKEPEDSTPLTHHDPEPVPSISHPHNYSYKIRFKIIPSSSAWSSKWPSSIRCPPRRHSYSVITQNTTIWTFNHLSPPKFCTCFLHLI